MAFFVDANVNNPQVQPTVIDTVAIGQWIEDFLLTRKGERLFNLDYGVDLEESLFDLIDSQNALIIFAQVTIQLEQNLPIVKVDPKASSIFPDYERNSYQLNVAYLIDGIENNVFSTSVTLGAA